MSFRTLVAPALLALVAFSILDLVGAVHGGDGAAKAPGFWTKDELRRIDEGLAVVNATRADLGFQKQPIDDPFRLDVVRRALDDPLSVGHTASEWDRIARKGDASAIVAWARQYALDAPPPRHPPHIAEPFDWPAAIPKGVADYSGNVLALGKGMGNSGQLPRTDEFRAVLRKALLSQVEKPSVAIAAPDLEDAEFLARVQKVDRAWLHADTAELVAAVAVLVRTLRETPPKVADNSPLKIKTPDGVVLIYGRGDDTHAADEAAALVIDLGGSDTYLRGASANALENRYVQIVIDLGGDDRYVGRNDFSFGGALGGVAIQWDGGGNDLYQAGHCSLGAGILGTGVLIDEGGDDVFRAKDFCEGAGAFGIGVLLKKGGNDLYHADLFGQGFASTWGCGVLADLGGNDTYNAGGEHLHAPLFRDRFQSLSQGFAIGGRPSASGGVGVLVDVKGNDRYVADIYAQGSSYWYSLGLLIDDDGHDTYVAGQYSCGAGIHLSAGMLLDRAGNDSYHCLNGVGVGGAHDFAVGFLVDRGGDDYYSGSGGSQGGALTNSVAMLIDNGGNDGYCAVRKGSQGVATPARGTGGIGLLLDGGGKDVYSENTRDGAAWVANTVGAGLDDLSAAKPGGEPQSAAIKPAAAERLVEERGKVEKDGARVWDLDKLWALASEWEVNDNRVIMPLARKQLWALGQPALDRAFERLGCRSTGSGLEYYAVEKTIVEFARTQRAAIVERLIAAARDDDVTRRKGAIALLGKLAARESVETLVGLLKTDPSVRRQALSALATMKLAPAPVAALLASKNELDGMGAAACLGAVGDERSIAALLGALSEKTPFLVRTAATERLAGLGERAVPGLAALAADRSQSLFARRNALRALGKSKSAAAAAIVIESLGSADRWTRLSAYGAARALADALEAAQPDHAKSLREAIATARAAESDPLLKRLR